MAVAEGMLISLEYTLKDAAGQLIESNEGADPVVYQHGAGQIIPGLEKAIGGMSVGESREVTVQPEEAYGVVSQEAFLEVPLEKIPEDARQIGAQLQTQNEHGQILRPVVSEVKEETAILDFNHPLAGKTLHFSVKVIAAEPPAEDGE